MIRSHFDNKYYPDEDEGTLFPSPELREFEIYLNKIFLLYTKNYYTDAAYSSVYITQGEDQKEVKDGFLVAILIKNRKNLRNISIYLLHALTFCLLNHHNYFNLLLLLFILIQ